MQLRLRASIAIFILFLSACSAPLGTVKYDSQKNPVQKIGIVTFNAPQKYYYHNIKNNAGNAFGLAGSLASGSIEASEQDIFTQTLKKQGFDFLGYFIEQLNSSMQMSGFKIESLKDLSKDPNILLEPEQISVSAPTDAIMDVKFSHVGYVSTAGPFSNTELKPVIDVIVTLISPGTKAIIYRETITYGTWNPFITPTIEADKIFTWESQEELLKDPAKLVDGLSTGSRALAQYIAQRLSQSGKVAMETKN